MLTYVSKEKDPRLDYVFNEISSYVGVNIVKGKKGEAVMVAFIPRGGKEPRVTAVIRTPSMNHEFEPNIASEFKWKGMSVPAFYRTGPKTRGNPILKDSKGRALITIDHSGKRVEIDINLRCSAVPAGIVVGDDMRAWRGGAPGVRTVEFDHRITKRGQVLGIDAVLAG